MILNDSGDTKSDAQILAYHKAKNKEKDRHILTLERQITALEAENRHIHQSLSFRLGALLTWPLRIIYGFFSPHKTQPVNPILSSCDAAVYAAGYLEVSGWALSDTAIKKIEVYANQVLMGQAELGIHRCDVQHSFADHPHSETSGYYFRINTKVCPDVIVVKVYDQLHCTKIQKVVIPSIDDMTINAQYQILLERNKLTTKDHQRAKAHMSTLLFQPVVSIIVPVFNVEARWLDLCIASLLGQWYPHWQLCLYDDASSSDQTRVCLQKWQNSDPRIEVKFGELNQGISLASNAAIAMAKGEFVGLLDHDDELTADALYKVVDVLNDDLELDFIYSDEDKIDHKGHYCDPHFKSDFNLSALLCHNYICHFSVIRKSIGDNIGWFRAGLEGSQDHDLFLRLHHVTSRIHHIPQVLYHWRKIPGSTALHINNKGYAVKSAKKAIQDYLSSENITAEVVDGLFTNSFRVKPLLSNQPLISIIIPFRDELSLLQSCINSIINKTDYPHYEVLLIDNQSTTVDMSQYLKQTAQQNDNIHVHVFDQPFNYAQLNNWAVNKAAGDFVLFLNNDMQVINNDWLSAMFEQISFDRVAAVGAKLLFADDTIQHAGIVVSQKGAVHINKSLPDDATGYCERANYIQNISACTAACLLVDKSIFVEVGGFNESQFSIAYNDVDLCLRMQQADYLVTYTPYAKLYHFESQSRGLDDHGEKLSRFTQEIKNYQTLWASAYQKGDPYYNPNLKPDQEKISLNLE